MPGRLHPSFPLLRSAQMLPVTDRHPALKALLTEFPTGTDVGQVRLSVHPSACELRHVADADKPESDLRLLTIHELRELAQFTAEGQFRPLKSAPTLKTGWRAVASTAADLDLALGHLYPGALADWFAMRSPEPPVTGYREFINRQTGMYRIAQTLSDSRAAAVTRAMCHPRHCLKQRAWQAGDLAPDANAGSGLLPCLEPCALLLELARRIGRMDKEPVITWQCPPSELETLKAALKTALTLGGQARTADFSQPANPQRVQLLIDKLEQLANPAAETTLE